MYCTCTVHVYSPSRNIFHRVLAIYTQCTITYTCTSDDESFCEDCLDTAREESVNNEYTDHIQQNLTTCISSL